MTDLIELKVPDIGDFDGVEVIEVLINVGDTVAENQDIVTLESDKAAMEIPALLGGVIQELKVKVGDTVREGDVLALVMATKENTTSNTVAEPVITDAEPVITEPEKTQPIVAADVPFSPDTNARKMKSHASPSVRQFARELGVDLTQVKGSSAKGRINKLDVQNFVKQKVNTASSSSANGSGIPTIAVPNFEKFGTVHQKPLDRIKKISGKHLHNCWLNVPHVTQFDEADITELEKFRKDNKDMAQKQGVNLTPLVFIIKAVVASLKLNPEFNSSLSEDKENIILKDYYNIGVAVDTPNGLMVPVLKDVDKKGFLEIAGELGDLSQRARDGVLTAKDLQGGTFSVSSLGGIGGSFFTPIVNSPEVAILGIGRHQMKPIWNGSEFEPKLMLPLSVSYDHRVIDGAAGARFTTQLSQMLSDIRKVLL